MSSGQWHEVVISGDANATACRHLLQHYERGEMQEDLCFGYWVPSTGLRRETAIVTDVVLPGCGDRNLHGNASFNGTYLARATREAIRRGRGLVFMHSHPSNGWQGMSLADVQAERNRIAHTARATGRPLVGMTVGMDGHWSARVWNDEPQGATRCWSRKVRIVDRSRLVVWHRAQGRSRTSRKLRRTVESWGEDKQRIIEGIRIGVVGLGSVGSIVAEGLARIGVRELVLIDDDLVEEHNLDRLLNASVKDIGRAKTDVAEEAVRRGSTADRIETINIRKKIQHEHAYAAARDCDILVCCVDSPVGRDVLNRISYRDGIPVVDGGVEIRKAPSTGNMNAARWKAHVVNPYNECLRCKGQYSSSDVILELDGSWENPHYIRDGARSGRRGENVFNVSLSAAAELLNLTIRLVIADPWWPSQQGIERNLVTGRTKARTGQCFDGCTIRRESWTGDAAQPLEYLVRDATRQSWTSKIAVRVRNLLWKTGGQQRGG